MAIRFEARVEPDAVEIRLLKSFLGFGPKPVPRAEWPNAGAPRAVCRALDALLDRGEATATADAVRLPIAAAAALTAEIADAVGLPPLAELGLAVALEGRVETPDGHLRLRWTDKSAREIKPARNGLVLHWGEKSARLSAPLLAVVEAAEAYNKTRGADLEARVAAWMPMQHALTRTTGGEVGRDGFLETFTLYQAGAFALEINEGDDFTPLLMARSQALSLDDDAPADDVGPGLRDGGGETDAPAPVGSAGSLLSADDHRAFLGAFAMSGATRNAYRLHGRNRFVLVDPTLKRALDVVQAKRRASPNERRAFLRNPRAALAEALRGTDETAPTATLFVETEGYSDRVAGLGLWEPPSIPWMTRQPNGWLPESGWTQDGAPVDPRPLSTEELADLERAYEAAEARGDSHMVIRGQSIPIDAAPAVLKSERERTEAANREAGAADGDRPPPSPADPEQAERLVLVIAKTNFEGLDYELLLKPRAACIALVPPGELMGPAPLKAHQVEGFRWLVEAWRTGWPGVLLADDMGLGKTFQALAFMAWRRRNADFALRRGTAAVAQGPVLVVAPTALLRNWEKECAERLTPEALGRLVKAYGRDLADLKLAPDRRSDPGETLDRSRLREADWILTTYETLTDHERAFGPIAFSLVLFDEMQKVKAPATLNTKAAKALNADFVVGLTGTPIENRMEDLWCLFDRLTPGYLGDLKSFSKNYGEGDPEKLVALKSLLDQPAGAVPPVMKRRMKADILLGSDALPPKVERVYKTPMPEEQRQAYGDLIAEARRQPDRSPGFMLGVLHSMRGLSLHPQDATSVNVTSADRFEAFARRSARLSKTVEILRDVRARGEKVLVFVEFLAMQDALADGLAALFDLPRRPSIVNGTTPGERRLRIVDDFAATGPGFGVLILSPKAAGVGLNITAANHVVHLSRWWNPAVEDQCNDRCYRIGQTKPVTIHIPLAVHPDHPDAAFDERLHDLLQRKRELSRTMLAPPTSEGDVGELFGATLGR